MAVAVSKLLRVMSMACSPFGVHREAPLTVLRLDTIVIGRIMRIVR